MKMIFLQKTDYQESEKKWLLDLKVFIVLGCIVWKRAADYYIYSVFNLVFLIYLTHEELRTNGSLFNGELVDLYGSLFLW